MSRDEQAIRKLIALWHSATAAGDIDTVLGLMAEDVIFLVSGQSPMRCRSSFERGLRELLTHHRIESMGEIQEIEVSGSLAYCWSMLAGGSALVRKGSALSILRKQPNGSWIVVRDANMLSLAS